MARSDGPSGPGLGAREISAASGWRRCAQIAGALFVLTKPRLAFFSVLTAMAAFVIASREIDAAHTLLTLLGTALSAAGALSLNQWWERRTDALMRRTRRRPLPSETIAPALALLWSTSLAVGGVGTLAVGVDPTAAALAAATIVIYGLIYTPLKRRTRWATEIGSVSGALPPLLGTAAAGDVAHPMGWLLAGVLVLWQMPHFFAIGWLHRADYRAAGLPLLPAIDPTGRLTGCWSFGYAILLLPASLLLGAWAHAGPLYFVVALLGGIAFAGKARRFWRDEAARDDAARALFLASIAYLPLLLAALMLDWWCG